MNKKATLDITIVISCITGMVLSYVYCCPKAQATLHELDPSKYKNPPGFVNDKVEEVYISGSENDDIKFFRYKD